MKTEWTNVFKINQMFLVREDTDDAWLNAKRKTRKEPILAWSHDAILYKIQFV